MIGFFCIYFGIFFVGDEVYVLLLKFLLVNLFVELVFKKVKVEVFYMMMGCNFEFLDIVLVGVVFGICGFEGSGLFKFGIICS